MVERFDLENTTVCGEAWREMVTSPEGDWVRYDDFRTIQAENERLNARISGCLIDCENLLAELRHKNDLLRKYQLHPK